MFVNKIEEVDRKKCRIYIEGKQNIILYKGEIRKYNISENSDLENDIYEVILKDVLYKRAFLKACHLLEKKDYTKYQLIMKLKQNEYPTEAIDNAIDKAIYYGYVNDDRYAYNYIESCIDKKSVSVIKRNLITKGINKDIIDKAFEIANLNGVAQNTSEMIRRILTKRHYYENDKTREEISKQYRYLLAKGFTSRDISQELKLDISI